MRKRQPAPLLVAHKRQWEDAFLPWRMEPDSLWLTTDLQELRMVVELQSLRAMRMAETFVAEVPHETVSGR